MASAPEPSAVSRISDTLNSSATRHWVKTALELALLREPGQAARDAQTLCEVLTEWCDGVLKASIAHGESAVTSIERVLADHGRSEWLCTALKLALHRDPVDAASDGELLRTLLVDRAVAMGQADAQHVDIGPSQGAQLPLSLRNGAD